MDYPYEHIWANGREVFLQEIIQGRATPLTEFEKSTFDFIASWASDEIAFSFHSSGTTGVPKTIVFQRDQLIASASMTCEALQLKRGDSALVCIDTKYVGGRMMLVRSLITGMSIFCVDPTSNPFEKIPDDLCVNFTAIVPLQLYTALGTKHTHLLNNIDKIIIGGAPLSEKIVSQLADMKPSMYLTYGMTETLSHVALRKLNGKDKQQSLRLLPGIKASVDERGCLVLDIPYLPQPIVTNDVVELIDRDRFIWQGRADHIINTGGVKVQPEKIETAVAEIFTRHQIPLSFFITGIADEKLGEKVVLVVEASGNWELRLRAIADEIFNSLPKFERPKEIQLASRFVFTETGKVSRSKSMTNIYLTFSSTL